MNILIIGSGGREHALAWKLAQAHHARIFITPGNPGTAQVGTNLSGSPADSEGMVRLARECDASLVVIGPEGPLAAGLADRLREAGFRVFGPSAAAARIESSKAFAKAFMEKYGIPAARSRTFTGLEATLEYLRAESGGLHNAAANFVIKASGLAAGKGVFLPENLLEAESILGDILVSRSLGEAGKEVLIEERLSGREVSVLAFTDGTSLSVMPPAQDHKRLLDDDAGPNTGGMGVYAPSPACPPGLLEEVRRTILQPAVDGLRAEGCPFTGVLYAGLMLTDSGPRVLEFNCRFGDPETQAILPLLESDLPEILLACSEGRLGTLPSPRWSGAAACVVLAAPGYPEQPAAGQAISGLELLEKDIWAFHAGTSEAGGNIAATGGRILGITAWAASLPAAIAQAYANVARVSFAGMHYRRDIGRDVTGQAGHEKTAYEQAGVSIAAGTEAVTRMKAAVRTTFTPQVLSDVGAFGGLFHAAGLKEMADPVLVGSTDGVGTKVALAAQAGSWAGVGHDIVNHCINDILVQGARPLFFLDYFAAGRLDPLQAAEIVGGISAACREAGCALLGGETAEMPGVYAPGHFDLAGTIIGVVEREMILPRADVRPGDILLGLASSGPHTNGYSLIRKTFARTPLDTVYPELGAPLAEVLLRPHRSYLPVFGPLLDRGWIKALAHITGGGFIDNIPRVLPEGCGVCIRPGSWPVPPLYRLIQKLAVVSEMEMYHVFNMGIGMVAVVAGEHLAEVRAAVSEQTWEIGAVTDGKGVSFE